MIQFSKSTKRGIGILTLLLLILVSTRSTWATPLYGGYNGESTAWTEYTLADVGAALFNLKITLGVDTNTHAWVRIVFSTVPFITRIEFTYDSSAILSGNFDTYLPWPIKIGSQIENNDENTPLLRWFSVYVILGVSGFDSERTIWTESGIPGVIGNGKDNNDNTWTWLKVLNWKFGVGEDITEEGGDLLNLQQSQEFGEELSSLQDYIDHTYGDSIRALKKQLTSQEVMLTVAQASNKTLFATRNPVNYTQSDGDCLSASVAATVFTEDVKAELKTLLDSFAQDVQPQLKKITESITTP